MGVFTGETKEAPPTLPGWVSEAGETIYNQASELASTPYVPYEGPRIADFSADEEAGFEAGRENVGSYRGALDQAGSYLDQAGEKTYQALDVGSTYQKLDPGSTYQPLERGAMHLGDKLNDPMARGWLEKSTEEFNTPQAQGWLERSAREWDTGTARQYMNPYTNQVSNIVKGRAQEDFDRAQLGRNTAAVRARGIRGVAAWCPGCGGRAVSRQESVGY